MSTGSRVWNSIVRRKKSEVLRKLKFVYVIFQGTCPGISYGFKYFLKN